MQRKYKLIMNAEKAKRNCQTVFLVSPELLPLPSDGLLQLFHPNDVDVDEVIEVLSSDWAAGLTGQATPSQQTGQKNQTMQKSYNKNPEGKRSHASSPSSGMLNRKLVKVFSLV